MLIQKQLTTNSTFRITSSQSDRVVSYRQKCVAMCQSEW